MDDSMKALFALYNFLAADKPIPPEDAYYLQDKVWDWLTTEEMSLDEAFGYAEAGTQAKGRRKKTRRVGMLIDIVDRYKAEGKSLDSNWVKIGKEIGMGGDYAKKLYYSKQTKIQREFRKKYDP